MHDLTTGSITRHILLLAGPIVAGMFFQTLYLLVDLYFVAGLGDEAIAGVAAAGNAQFIIMALTQVLNVGTMASIAHATGRKDRDEANVVFNQSLTLAVCGALLTMLAGYSLGGRFTAHLAADAATAAAGTRYLYWFLPALALQFVIAAMGAALRGTGIAKPTMLVQMSTVILNVILAPVLIAGWGTGKPMGVAGAGLASTLAVAIGTALMALYFLKLERYVGFNRRLWALRFDVWRRILRIGLPPGGEFALMFVYLTVIYWLIRGFGSEAQAGFGIGMRVMQAIFLPAMAIAFATGPVAGQNFSAGRFDRVTATFRSSAVVITLIMLLLTAFSQWRPAMLIGVFTTEAGVIAVGGEFLRIISWNFIASGLIFTCSGIFQALGNTLPPLFSNGTRLLTFVVPGVVLAGHPGFELRHLWALSVASVALQAVVSLGLLRHSLHRLRPPASTRPASA